MEFGACDSYPQRRILLSANTHAKAFPLDEVLSRLSTAPENHLNGLLASSLILFRPWTRLAFSVSYFLNSDNT